MVIDLVVQPFDERLNLLREAQDSLATHHLGIENGRDTLNRMVSDDVFADSAYRSAETEAKLKARGFRSRIHVRASRGHPLSKAEEDANRKRRAGFALVSSTCSALSRPRRVAA